MRERLSERPLAVEERLSRRKLRGLLLARKQIASDAPFRVLLLRSHALDFQRVICPLRVLYEPDAEQLLGSIDVNFGPRIGQILGLIAAGGITCGGWTTMAEERAKVRAP